MKREYKLFLKDIAESCRFIQAFVEGIDFEQFMKDEKTLSAVIRKLEVIGEAAKNIPDSLKKKYPHIQWKKMTGMRDRLIHGYFGISVKLIWGTIKTADCIISEKISEDRTFGKIITTCVSLNFYFR